jgi:hypothetical protein
MMKILIKWQAETHDIFFKSSAGAEGVIRSPYLWLLTSFGHRMMKTKKRKKDGIAVLFIQHNS